MGRPMDPSRAARCPTCGTEHAGPVECAGCSSDQRRSAFVALAVQLLEHADEGLIARAREISGAACWPGSVLRRLLAEAKRRHVEADRLRDRRLRLNHAMPPSERELKKVLL